MAPSTVVPTVAFTIRAIFPISNYFLMHFSSYSEIILPFASVLTETILFVPNPHNTTPFLIE